MKKEKTDSKMVRIGKAELKIVQVIKAGLDKDITQEELINIAIREYYKDK